MPRFLDLGDIIRNLTGHIFYICFHNKRIQNVCFSGNAVRSNLLYSFVVLAFLYPAGFSCL